MKSLLLIIFLTPNLFANGGAVGNGGGFALCQDQRYYSYDYLLTLNHNPSPSIAPANLNQSIQFIFSQLKRLQDPLAAEFVDFFSIIFTQTKGKKFQWFLRKNLPLMWEPDIVDRLPSSCKLRKQAVYFFAAEPGVPYSSYSYDPDLIYLVQNQPLGSLQVSYLWVHEWLWNYFSRDDFMKLADFNRLLHSKALETMSATDYYRMRPRFLLNKR